METRIPEGVLADIQASGVFADSPVDPNRFPRVGNGYQSPDFVAAANWVEIEGRREWAQRSM